MPALCAGGVLLHSCDCGHTDGCGHESECATDPCEVALARPHEGNELAVDLHFADHGLPTVVRFVDSPVPTSVIWFSPPRFAVGPGSLAALTTTVLVI